MTDIVWQVKLAMDGIDTYKNQVEELMQKVYEQLSSGDPVTAIQLLSQVFSIGTMLIDQDVLTSEFKDFLSDEGLKEWVQDFDPGRNFSEFDNQAIEIIAKEISGLVGQDALFKGDEISVSERDLCQVKLMKFTKK